MAESTLPNSASNSSTNPGAQPAKSEFREMIDSVFWALIVVVFLRSFLVEPFKIPSGSMIPTLKVGDYILVTKFFYTLGLPLSKIKVSEFRKPQRGDVIVFLYPRDESKNYIKRVVGVPGDKIEVHEGRLHINGNPVRLEQATTEERQKALVAIGSEYRLEMLDLYKEYINPNQWHFALYDRANTASFNVDYVFDVDDDGIADPIPPGHYFAMGDNRDHSADSRMWDLVPEENIKGKALAVWMSLDPEQPLLSAGKVRWKEILRKIE